MLAFLPPEEVPWQATPRAQGRHTTALALYPCVAGFGGASWSLYYVSLEKEQALHFMMAEKENIASRGGRAGVRGS